MSSRLPTDEALEKEERIDEIKKKKHSPPIPHLLRAQQAPALPYAKVVGRPGTWSYPAPSPDPTTHRNYFMTKSLRKMVLDPRIKPATSWIPVGRRIRLTKQTLFFPILIWVKIKREIPEKNTGQPASRTWLVSHVNRARFEPTAVRWSSDLERKRLASLTTRPRGPPFPILKQQWKHLFMHNTCKKWFRSHHKQKCYLTHKC